MPLFSIVIPTLNAAATLGETLSGIQAQDFPDWELILVDDGSTDGTDALVAGLARSDARIRMVANPGKGPSDARNHGALGLARGEIVAFCDADDIWTPGKLTELAGTFEDAAIDAAFGQIGFFRQAPQDARVFSTVPAGAVSVPMLMGENCVCTMSNLAVRRDCMIRTGGFDRDMVHNEDLEWLIRLVGGGSRLVGIDSLHVFYRTSPTGLSADLTAMRAGRRRALASAARLGFRSDRRAEAVHLRYLARRALRLDAGPWQALGLAASGLWHSPAGFLSPARRGAATALAALAAPFMPRALRHALFSR